VSHSVNWFYLEIRVELVLHIRILNGFVVHWSHSDKSWRHSCTDQASMKT